jgi:DNA-binding GntR family transcriptional regulator
MPKDSPRKHRDISRQLIAEIAEGKYAESKRLPSEAQLVKRFGVSRPTVGRALRDLQTEGLIESCGAYLPRAATAPTLT